LENDNLRFIGLDGEVDGFQARTQLRFKHQLLDPHSKFIQTPAP
jgi:hypothetical protein